MIVYQRELSFHNLLIYTGDLTESEFEVPMIAMTKIVLESDNFSNGPLIYTREKNPDGKTEHCVFMRPLGVPATVSGKDNFSFETRLQIKKCLMVRHADVNEDIEISCNFLREYAKENGIQLKEPFYFVMLDLYGDIIQDIYAPVVS